MGFLKSSAALLVAALFLPFLTARSTAASEEKKSGIRAVGPSVLDPGFVKKFRATPNSSAALNMSYPEKIPSPSVADELRVLAGEGLAQEQRTLSSQIIYMDVASRAMGTPQGDWALHALDLLAQENELDESALEEMAYEYDANVDESSARAMIAWFRAKALLRRGYDEWALLDLAKIATDTRWHSDRMFDRATDVLTEGRADEAESLYDDLLKRPLVRNATRQFTELNRARLIFEKGDYENSLRTVRSLDLPLREKARAMLEMAWARYYTKEYGKALGVLKVIDSPFFESLRSPETDLLRMVIERDLCRYDLINASAAEFHERYKKSFRQIEARLDLDADAQLKQMALQGRFLQKRATLIHRYRAERKAIYDEDLKVSPGLREILLQRLLMRERKIEAEIARSLPRELERVASELLDLRAQVSFLEYEASIRPLTKLPTDDVDYRPEVASRTRFEKHWPVAGEAWWDELNNYEVLIRARCSEPLPILAPVPVKKRPTTKVEPQGTGDDEEEDDEDDE